MSDPTGPSSSQVGCNPPLIEGNRRTSLSSVKAFLSGGFGGICLVLIGHPLDLIKVRMQTSVPGEFNGLLDCWRCVFRSSGVRGIYRGVLPPLLGVVPMMATSFWGYHVSQNLCRSLWALESGEKLGPLPTTVAGGLSAFPTVLLATPGERVKCLMQVSGNRQPKPTMVEVARQVLHSGGLRSLYKGTTITLIRDVPGSMAYFATYDILKTLFSKPVGQPNQPPPFYSIMLAGGLAGLTNWFVAIPPDVLKSRIQTCPNDLGISQAYRDLIKSEGWGGLYRGLGPAMLRAFPANAACFYGVEVSRKFLDKLF